MPLENRTFLGKTRRVAGLLVSGRGIMKTHPGVTLEGANTIVQENYLREETFKYVDEEDGSIKDGGQWYFFDTDKFLYIGPTVCRRLPSDSHSRGTPLPLAVTFPLSGRFGDFHPLEYVRAGRTTINEARPDLVIT